MTATDNLIAAWAQKCQEAQRELALAAVYPALFKPEWVERAAREHAGADRQIDYWTRIGGGE